MAQYSQLTPREWGSMPAAEFAALLGTAPKKVVPGLLRLRFRHNLKDFARYCWPERFDLPFSALHDDLFTLGDVPRWDAREKPDSLHAIAAPRGFAKSTIVSFLQIAHAIVYDIEAYILLMSSTQRLALSLSGDLLGLFRPGPNEDTRRLSRLYGPFNTSGGKSEWEVSVGGRPSVGVLAVSFGQDVRGAKHPQRGIRPTCVVLDDAEKKDRVRNPEQRALWEGILNSDILKLSDRSRGTAFRFVGTILHPDSTLARRETDPGWAFSKYKAIIRWPDNLERWERCRQIWADLTLGDARRRAAEVYYATHREEMDAGAKLLDPGGTTLFQLFTLMWAQGRSSFLKEMQNDPVDPTTQIFVSEQFSKFVVRRSESKGLYVETIGELPRKVLLSAMKARYIRWDPALGNVGGDYAAVATVVVDKWGYKYVLSCRLGRYAPSVQRSIVWRDAEFWGVSRGSIESNGFQELCSEPFHRERQTRRETNEFWRFQLESDPSTTDKLERIATNEPDITNGWLLFNRDLPHEVFGQYDHFPTAAHDDAPDAIQGAAARIGTMTQTGMRRSDGTPA